MSGEFQLISTAINNTTIAGLNWVIGLGITALILLITTRNTNKWKILAFPTLIMLNNAGIYQSWILITISGIIFVLESLSLETVSMYVSKAKKTWENINITKWKQR